MRRIVGEASKNWPNEDLEPIARKFETLIAVNADRGFMLEDWRYAKVVYEVPAERLPGGTIVPSGVVISETIIAVFVECAEVS